VLRVQHLMPLQLRLARTRRRGNRQTVAGGIDQISCAF
jgi:hypothetical protein